jgi:hypothetical protein
MKDKMNTDVKIDIPEIWAAELEKRAATMHLEADEYCYAVLALSLQQEEPLL